MLIEKLYWITNDTARMQVIFIYVQLEIYEMQGSKTMYTFFSNDGTFSLLMSSIFFFFWSLIEVFRKEGRKEGKWKKNTSNKQFLQRKFLPNF